MAVWGYVLGMPLVIAKKGGCAAVKVDIVGLERLKYE
jgi:hypothetical protein